MGFFYYVDLIFGSWWFGFWYFQEHNENLERTKKLLMEEKEEEIRRSEELRTSNSKKQKEIERFNQRKLELDSILKEASN